ncbi:acetylxylan esterase [Eubacteriales bacterium mix99]|jgi:cephalosporin-C deacetylase|nr:acetylxylan esterase [Clostridiales bacterium]
MYDIREKTKDLFAYRPPLTREADFDVFWRDTIAASESVPLNPKMEKYGYPSPYVSVYSVEYNGFDETGIHGWYLVPEFVPKENLPCLIHYHGFSGNRGMPADFMQWIMMGVAVLSVDCRDQSGVTGNCADYSGGYTKNVVCKGILDKNEYYFRAVYMDCKKAIDFACSRPEINPKRIAMEGGSQGGALTMAVCALDSRPALALADVPSNSNLEKRVEGAHGSFSSVTDYLKLYPQHTEKAFETLSYFDTMNLASRIQCRVLASVGLQDSTCPAKLYFATYNRITSPKEIRIYPFNAHDGGRGVQNEVKLNYLAKYL